MANDHNLIPAKKGEVRNPKGKPKGTKHLSTLIRNIGEDIDWNKTTLKDREDIQTRYGNNAWEAITYVAFTKAMSGDDKAMRWLAENGFGKHLDITTDGEKVNNKLQIEWLGDKPNDQDTTG